MKEIQLHQEFAANYLTKKSGIGHRFCIEIDILLHYNWSITVLNLSVISGIEPIPLTA